MRRAIAAIASAALCIGVSHAQTFNCRLYIPDFLTTGTLVGAQIATTINTLATKPFVIAKNDPASTCTMATMDSAIFPEMVIFDPTPLAGYTSNFYVYHPLVVDQLGDTMAAPSKPLLAANPVTQGMFSGNAVAAIWFGTNNGPFTFFDTVTNPQPTAPVASRHCFSGPPGSLTSFIQFGVCNTDLFWQTIDANLATSKNGALWNPPLPTLGMDPILNKPCLTTRDFALVDQDPSDNVVTTFLVNADTGAVAQDTPNNQRLVAAMNANTMLIANPSDQRQIAVAFANAYLALGNNPATGKPYCQPYKVPNLTNNMQTTIGALALNEIHAHVYAPLSNQPLALIPRGDPMVRRPLQTNEMTLMAGTGNMATNLLGDVAPAGAPDLVRVNLMRKALYQPQIDNLGQASTLYFCNHFVQSVIPMMNNPQWKDLFLNAAGVNMGQNLYAFLSQRMMNTYNMLGCPSLLDIPNPVTLLPIGSNPMNCMDSFIQDITAQAAANTNIKDPYQFAM